MTGDVADEFMDASKDGDSDEEDENSDEDCCISPNYDTDEISDCPLSQLFYLAMSLKNLLYNNNRIFAKKIRNLCNVTRRNIIVVVH